MSSKLQELHADNKSKHVAALHDALMDDLGDTNFADMHEFQYLVTLMAALEDQVKQMNDSLTNITSLLHEFVCKSLLGNASKS